MVGGVGPSLALLADRREDKLKTAAALVPLRQEILARSLKGVFEAEKLLCAGVATKFERDEQPWNARQGLLRLEQRRQWRRAVHIP